MDPGSSAAATGTLYGAIALVIIALVPFLRDLVQILRDYLNRRWKTAPTPAIDHDEQHQHAPPALSDEQRKDVQWLQRRIATLELALARCRREGERYQGEVEQLRGEVEFLVDQLQEAVQERDEALAREAGLRRDRARYERGQP